MQLRTAGSFKRHQAACTSVDSQTRSSRIVVQCNPYILQAKQNLAQNVSQLAQPFPNNILGETAPGMKDMFPAILEMQQGKKEAGQQAGQEQAGQSPAPQAEDPFADTLGGELFYRINWRS